MLADIHPSFFAYGLITGAIGACFLWVLMIYERVKRIGLKEIEDLVTRKKEVVKAKMESAPTDLAEAFLKEIRAAAGGEDGMKELMKSAIAGAVARSPHPDASGTPPESSKGAGTKRRRIKAKLTKR